LSPFFSIIIPTYNRAHLIGKAIESVLVQTFTGWELIVVDDGSTDNTREVVASYKDPRIHYVYQQNAERSAARNKGISHARGQYICFLDSDDYYLPERLELLSEAINQHHQPVALFYTDISFDDGNNIRKVKYEIHGNKINTFDFLAQVTIGVPQVCVHRKILSLELFNPQFRIGEDFELWLRIADNFPLIYLENNFTMIACEHEDRSVNIKKHNSAAEQRTMYRYAFKAPHPGSKISKPLQKSLMSNSFFNSARYFMARHEKANALYHLWLSLTADISHAQSRHKLWCMGQLLQGNIPRQYQ
jgi:glycosyltransferase involved in cell wall biosynthesis